jgi:hypothetical protein
MFEGVPGRQLAVGEDLLLEHLALAVVALHGAW